MFKIIPRRKGRKQDDFPPHLSQVLVQIKRIRREYVFVGVKKKRLDIGS